MCGIGAFITENHDLTDQEVPAHQKLGLQQAISPTKDGPQKKPAGGVDPYHEMITLLDKEIGICE